MILFFYFDELVRNDGNSNFNLIRWKLQCSNFNSNLISGFGKNANLSNDLKTRMHPRAMKVTTKWSQMLRRHPITEKQKQLILDPFLFSFTAAVQTMWLYQWLLLRHTAYPLTRRSDNSHGVLTTVIQLGWGVLGQGPCNHGGQGRRNGGAWRVHRPPAFSMWGNGS